MSSILTLGYGAAIGVANIIPGLSGSTIAVILGVYPKLIHAITEVSSFQFKKSTILFLAQLGLGAIFGIVLFSKLMLVALEHYYHITSISLMILVLIGLPRFYKAHPFIWSIQTISILLISIIAAGVTAFLTPDMSATTISTGYHLEDLALLFGSGFIAATAMIVPGISGSLLLMIIGTYTRIISAISTINIVVLGIVGIGAGVGVIVSAKGIDYVIQRFPNQTYACILGLLLGTLIKLWP